MKDIIEILKNMIRDIIYVKDKMIIMMNVKKFVKLMKYIIK